MVGKTEDIEVLKFNLRVWKRLRPRSNVEVLGRGQKNVTTRRCECDRCVRAQIPQAFVERRWIVGNSTKIAQPERAEP